MQAFNGKKWEKFNSEKVASLAYARIQGKSALISHFQNSSLMNEDKRCRPIVFQSEGQGTDDLVRFRCNNINLLEILVCFLVIVGFCFLLIQKSVYQIACDGTGLWVLFVFLNYACLLSCLIARGVNEPSRVVSSSNSTSLKKLLSSKLELDSIQNLKY